MSQSALLKRLREIIAIYQRSQRNTNGIQDDGCRRGHIPVLKKKMIPGAAGEVESNPPPIHFYVDEEVPLHLTLEAKPSAMAVALPRQRHGKKAIENGVSKKKGDTAHGGRSSKRSGPSANEKGLRIDNLLLESVLTEMKRFNAMGLPGSTQAAAPSPLHTDPDSQATMPPPTADDQLLARLIDLERESVAVARGVEDVGELARRLAEPPPRNRQQRHVTLRDAALLRDSCAGLAEQLEAFDVNNRVLRSLMRQREEEERERIRLGDQRDSLLVRHGQLETMNKRFQMEILDREKQLEELRAYLNAQRDENLVIASNQNSSETARVHLHKQLRTKEGDCNRMAVQIRQLESQLAQERIDSQHMCGVLQQAKEKAERDKEPLKRAARAQKERANRLAEEVDRLHTLLVDKEPLLEQLVMEEEEREKGQGDEAGDDEREVEPVLSKSVNASPDQNASAKRQDSPSVNGVIDEERKAYESLVKQHREECKRADQRLHNFELRLRNAEERNRSLVNQLGDTSSLLESTRSELREAASGRLLSDTRMREVDARLEDVRRERDALQQQLEVALADVRRHREIMGESSVERRLRQRVKVLEQEQSDLRETMDRLQREKSVMERHCTNRLADMTSRIESSSANNRCMQQYVQHLRSTYDKCFGKTTSTAT